MVDELRQHNINIDIIDLILMSLITADSYHIFLVNLHLLLLLLLASFILHINNIYVVLQ